MKLSCKVNHSILAGIAAIFLVTIAGAQAAAEKAGTEKTPEDIAIEAEMASYPLKPADTGSPRDTLKGFLTNVSRIIRDYQQGNITAAGEWTYVHAVESLDFSTTPYGNSWAVRTERILLLKELLDRLEIPPDDQIPGDREVADGAVTKWTLPNTRISIARIETGPRAGEFLFTAETVQRLGEFYRKAKHLPYKPGASKHIYEVYMKTIEKTRKNKEGTMQEEVRRRRWGHGSRVPGQQVRPTRGRSD